MTFHLIIGALGILAYDAHEYQRLSDAGRLNHDNISENKTNTCKQEKEKLKTHFHRDCQAQLLEFIDACLDYQSLNRETYLLYIDLIGCFGEARDKYDLTISMNRRTRELLVKIIEAGQANGEIARMPSHDLADVVQGFVDGLMEMCALDPNSVNIKGCKKLIRKMILNTIEP